MRNSNVHLLFCHLLPKSVAQFVFNYPYLMGIQRQSFFFSISERGRSDAIK